MREQLIGLTASGLLLGLGAMARGLRRNRGPGLWVVLQELARSCGAVLVERAHRRTTMVVLDRVADGGRIRVTDGTGSQRCYEVERPVPRPVDE